MPVYMHAKHNVNGFQFSGATTKRVSFYLSGSKYYITGVHACASILKHDALMHTE